MAKFEHVRISLGRPGKPPMIEMLDHSEPVPDRTEWLRRAFSSARDFSISGRTYRFVPIAAPEGFVAGFFGRQVMFASFRPRDLSPTNLEGWDRSLFVMDLAIDSQIAAMQETDRVGSPRNVLQNFLNVLTTHDGFRDYEPHVQYIVEHQSYWRIIDKFEGHITKLTFTFIPPNALKSTEEVMQFIKEASEEANSSLIKHTYESENGKLNPKADLLKGSANVALDGGGEVEVGADGRTVYSSNQSKKVTVVPKSEVPADDDLAKLLLLIGRLFGSER